jgi:hypothetical protein
VHAVLEAEAELPRRQAEDDRPQLGAVVLEREIDVSGAPRPAVRNLAFDQDPIEGAFDE